jgi:hypothetical protein
MRRHPSRVVLSLALIALALSLLATSVAAR